LSGELDAATGDFSGDVDVDGTLETDALTIGGTTLLANDSNNRVTTATGSGTLNGEANLTFDGSTLAVTGALSATGNVSFDGGSFVFNESGADKDFRIEGDSQANLFFADASTDRIGIGTNSPTNLLEVEGAAGSPTSASGAGGIAYFTGADSDSGIAFGSFDSSPWNNWIQSQQDNGTVSDLVLQPRGGSVYIGEANAAGAYGNANMTQGLTINQEANDNEAFALKSSDIAHGRTSTAETDTYFKIQKSDSSMGGASMTAISEDAANQHPFQMYSHGGTPATSKSTGTNGLFFLSAAEHDGSNSQTGVTANGNIWAIRAYQGSAWATAFVIDEDGDYHYNGADGGAFDFNESLGGEINDAELVRAMMLETSDPRTVVRSKFDKDLRYNKDHLIAAGILGYCSPEEEAKGHKGLVNGAQLQRLHHGAIWQNHIAVQELKEVYENRIAALEQRLLRLEA